MKTTRKQRRVASFLSAIVLLLQITPALAGGPLEKENKRSVVVTFTKWITTYPLMAGYVGGAVTGDFAGEIFERRVSANGRIIQLEPIYEVIDQEPDPVRNRSFTALIRGGTNNVTGKALLDGVILAGWRTGARVHVEFKATMNCADAPLGPCFQGTIRILSDSDD